MGEALLVQKSETSSMSDIYYDAGEEYGLITGGWRPGYQNLTTGHNITQTKETDHLKIVLSRVTSGNDRTSWQTTSKVDLTDYSALEFDWEGTATVSDPRDLCYAIQVVNATQAAQDELNYTASYGYTWTFARETGQLDISAVSGEYYVRFIIRCVSTRSYTGKLYSIKAVE